MKKKILFVLLLGLILYPANKVTNYNISSVDYKEGNEVDNQIEVEWKKDWGGNGSDYFNSVIETQDGYIAVGYSLSDDIEDLTNKGAYDAIIVKYDKNGNIIWQKNWGGNDSDYFDSVIETQDGYIVVGHSYSTDIEGLYYKDKYDAIIVKYDKNGNIIWQKNWGGNGSDYFDSLIETQDGYIAVGYSHSTDIEGLYYKGSRDAIIVKYDKNGNIIWQKNWGGGNNDYDYFTFIIETQDGYIAAGYTSTGVIIVKYDKNGNIIWQKIVEVNISGYINSIIEVQDGYIGVGDDFNKEKGNRDAIIFKYDKNGNIIWQKNWGGNNDDDFTSIIEIQDGYIAVGTSASNDIEGLNYKNGYDAIIVKYDKNGNIIWQKTLGGNYDEEFNSIIETQDGFVAVGESGSGAVIVKFRIDNTIDNSNNNKILNDNSENNNKILNDNSENNNNNVSTENNTNNTNNNQETVVDAPNTLSFISKTLLIISGLLIVFGIGLYGYNLYKLKKNSK